MRHFIEVGNYTLNHQVYPDAKPEDSQSFLERGDKLREEDQYEEAFFHYNNAVHADPNNATAHSSLGVLFYQMELYEQALAEYNKSLDLELDAVVFYNRALALMELKRQKEALADLTEALELDPWDMDIVQAMIELRLKIRTTTGYF